MSDNFISWILKPGCLKEIMTTEEILVYGTIGIVIAAIIGFKLGEFMQIVLNKKK